MGRSAYVLMGFFAVIAVGSTSVASESESGNCDTFCFRESLGFFEGHHVYRAEKCVAPSCPDATIRCLTEQTLDTGACKACGGTCEGRALPAGCSEAAWDLSQ